MHELLREALLIKNDLGNVVFVGAVGVLAHTKFGRESLDLDFVAAEELSDEFLEEKEYFKHGERGKEVRRTPRGYKIDIYTKDLNEIPVNIIVSTAKDVSINKKNDTLKVASLEVLIVTKHRAGRLQDNDDLSDIARKKFKEIQWTQIQSLTTDVEYANIRTAMKLRAA